MSERHPIADCPVDSNGELLPLERRCQLLEIHLAMLWDQVWWMQLPEEQRKQYEAEGFTAPIAQFYIPIEEHGSDQSLS